MFTSSDLAFSDEPKPAVRDVVSKRTAIVKPLEVATHLEQQHPHVIFRDNCVVGMEREHGEQGVLLPAVQRG